MSTLPETATLGQLCTELYGCEPTVPVRAASSMLSPAFLTALQTEVVTLQEKHPVLATALDRARAILADGRLFPEEDGHTASVRGGDGGWYFVNGVCPCKAGLYRPEPCKHRLALRLYQRVSAALVETTPVVEPPASHGETPVDIPAHFLVELHGKQFIVYAGLLALAHARGLTSLTARFISVTSEIALAEATAVFRDGRTFSEAADATPGNVSAKVKAHFPRMALTRAKARALRDGLNISMCSLEEVE